MLQSRAGVYGRLIGAALIVSALLAAVAPQREAQAVVTAVRGEACGYYVHVGLFGGPQNRRGCGQPATAPLLGRAPSVALPPGGSATPITASDLDGAKGDYGPASIFAGIWPLDVATAPASGPLHVSTQGTPEGGVVRSTADITLHDEPVPVACYGGEPGNLDCTAPGGFGPGPVEGDSLHAECTATEDGVIGSASFVNGLFTIATDAEGGPLHQEPIPNNPPPNYTRSGVITNVGDVFAVVFNQQIVNPDGSLTVNAVHMYLFGPVAVGEMIEGQVTCGTTPPSATPADTVAPICGVPVVKPIAHDNPAPRVPREELIGVADAGGLKEITNVQVTNGTVRIGTDPDSVFDYLKFVEGQTGPLGMTAIRTDAAEASGLPMTWSFDAIDMAGNVTHCQGILPSRVDSLLPASGPIAGGNKVAIGGTGFTDATAVTFGTTPATDLRVDSDTQVTVTAPPGAAGMVNVTVVTPRGSWVSPPGEGYTYLGPPTTSTSSTTTTSSTVPDPSSTTTSSTVPDPSSTTTSSTLPTSTSSTTPTTLPTSTSSTAPTSTSSSTTTTTVPNPVAFDDHYDFSGGEDELDVPPRGVLANDADPGGNAATLFVKVSETTGPQHGTLLLDNDGSFTYTPDDDYPGNDTFTYTVENLRGNTDTADVTIGEDLSEKLVVEVNPSPQSRPVPGGPFTFDVLVTNLGDKPLKITKFDDNVYEDVVSRGSCKPQVGDEVLEKGPGPGNTYSCSYPGEFHGTDGETQTSTLTVTAAVVGRSDEIRTASDDATVRISGTASEDDDTPPTTIRGTTTNTTLRAATPGGSAAKGGSSTLAKTGSGVVDLLWLAAVLTVLGGRMLRSGRSRRRSSGAG